MKRTHTLIAAAVAALFVGGAFAQTTATEVQRNVNQQKRIEQGLKSGELSTKEAAKLEKEEAKVNRDESRALRDGKLSASEKAKIQAEQNKVSEDIHKDKTNDIKGNPNSASSKRMQADVQRNVNQQERIEQGVKSGSLTKRETAGLEKGQAHVERKEARAGKDGHVSASEQAGIQHAENKQSKRIHKEKTDAEVRK
jgi:hypothetical protein